MKLSGTRLPRFMVFFPDSISTRSGRNSEAVGDRDAFWNGTRADTGTISLGTTLAGLWIAGAWLD